MIGLNPLQTMEFLIRVVRQCFAALVLDNSLNILYIALWKQHSTANWTTNGMSTECISQHSAKVSGSTPSSCRYGTATGLRYTPHTRIAQRAIVEKPLVFRPWGVSHNLPR